MSSGSRISRRLRTSCSPLWYLVPLVTLAAIVLGTTTGFGQGRLSVPDVRFHTYAQAQCILGLHGLNIRLNRASGAVRGPVVVRQEPEAGAPLVHGDAVVVTLGSPNIPTRQLGVTVPPLIGTHLDTARAVLQNSDLCATTDPRGVRSGAVIGQDPPTGTRVPRGTTITLRVGEAPNTSGSTPLTGNAIEPPRGPLVVGPQFHEIPNVVGQRLDVAAQMLGAAGFAVGRVTRESSNEAPGTVTAQAPKGGTLVPSFVPSRIRIDLTVAVPIPEVRPRVPNVVGQLLDDATPVLVNAGFTVGRITRGPSNEAPGTVTAQTPEGGAFAPLKAAIALTVAVRQQFPVPDVVGRPLAEAARMLAEAGFTVGRVTRAASNEAPETVTAQTPEGGIVAPPKAAIALTVAVPPPPPRVPDVVGQSLDDARRLLAEADFTVGRVARAPSNEAPGTVTAQTPEGGTPAQPRTGIALTVAIPRPQDKPRVPDVVGRSLDDARRTLAEAGFAVGRVTRGISSEMAGTVTAEAPPAGTPAPLKTAIDLTVAIPQPPPRVSRVPDLVGRPLAEAARMLAGAGFTVGRVTQAPSNEAPGTVIAQTPEGGTPAQPRTGIALTVAIPPTQDRARVPNVLGQSLDDARRSLAVAGFAVGGVTRTASNEAPGIVTRQAPVGDTVVVPPLPAVNLTLAAIKVPGVVGQLFDPAKSDLERANFTVQATLQPSDRPRGTVTNQDPVAGALVIPPLPVVKVTVAAAEVPSVVGRSLDAATRTLGDAGFTVAATGWPQVAFARVVDQKPAGGTLVTSAQAVVTLTVRTEAGRWLPAIVGFLLGVGGSIAASKVRARPKPAPRLMRMHASRDLGTQEIRLGAQAIRGGADIVKDPDVRLKPVTDPGDPNIERPEDVLPTEEGDDHA